MAHIVDEQELIFDNNRYNVTTAESVGKLDIIYSYFNHRQFWMEMHHDFWKVRSLSKEFLRLSRWWFQYRFGHRKTADLSGLKGKGSGPAIIIGSGPSLDAALPRLKKEWKGAIFCATSQAPTLVRYGIHPDFIEVIDPRIEDWEMKAPWDYRKTQLIAPPTVRPAIFDRWAGKKWVYRIYEPNVPLYGHILPLAYPDIATYSYPFGAVIPLLVTHAHYLGYGPLYLVGCDFGYPEGGLTRFARYDYLGRGRWKELIPTTVEQDMKNADELESSPPTEPGKPNKYRCYVRTKNGVMSELLHVHYRNQLLRVIAFDLSEVLCVPGGILTPDQVPYISLDELLSSQGQLPPERRRTKEQILRNTTKALMQVGIYVANHSDGARSMASLNNWRKELKVVVDIFNKQGGKVDYAKELAKFAELQREIDQEQGITAAIVKFRKGKRHHGPPLELERHG